MITRPPAIKLHVEPSSVEFNARPSRPGVFLVRPAGRTCLTVNIANNEVSLLTTLQREGPAEGQLRRREASVGRKPMAKRWPDEQQPHTRRARRVRSPISSNPEICTEGAVVNVAGISVKAGAHYPGRSVVGLCPSSFGASVK